MAVNEQYLSWRKPLEVRAIRDLAAAGWRVRAIADLLCWGQTSVRDVIQRRTWRQVP